MTYPQKDQVDEFFFTLFLKERMPLRIFDAHIHLNLPAHIPAISDERLHSDWAFECGLYLTVEDALTQGQVYFGNTPYQIAGFPWPIREADLAANNVYLKRKCEEGFVRPLMGIRPDWPAEELDRQLPFFCGCKPYPDFVSTQKGSEVSIFSFMSHAHLQVLNKHKKAVVIHLPRKERLADATNVRELLEMRQQYPDIQIIIAHFGRSFCPSYLEKGLNMMGRDADGFYFDTAAVLNPLVYQIAFERIAIQRILFGTDGPIMYWHGKRRWSEYGYENLCRESYSWNRHIEGSDVERGYTFVLYEQMKAILDTLDKLRMGEAEKDQIFFSNAHRLLLI